MTIVSTGAGHGGKKNNGVWTDPGAVGSGYKEADVARTINNKMLTIAKCKDTTDNAGTSINNNLTNIARNINAGADGYAISNHLNAFNGKATGVEVLYGSTTDKAIAAKLSAAIAKATGLVDRGAKDGTWLYIARNSGAGKKVLLIEWGFIDNKSDMKKLMDNMDKGVKAAMEVLGYKSTTNNTPVKNTYLSIKKPTIVKALQDVLVYNDKERKKVSSIVYKKGSVFFIDKEVAVPGSVKVGQPRSGGYCTLNDKWVAPRFKQ